MEDEIVHLLDVEPVDGGFFKKFGELFGEFVLESFLKFYTPSLWCHRRAKLTFFDPIIVPKCEGDGVAVFGEASVPIFFVEVDGDLPGDCGIHEITDLMIGPTVEPNMLSH